MEFHEPASLPCLKCVQVLLEFDGIIDVVDNAIYNTIICKESYTRPRRKTVRQVVYIRQEQ